eukprot:scaffold262795_cov58-Attheya_sp.AAC.1
MKQTGGDKQHKQAREQPKSALALGAFEHKDLDHACGIHALVKGEHNFWPQIDGIRNPFQYTPPNK